MDDKEKLLELGKKLLNLEIGKTLTLTEISKKMKETGKPIHNNKLKLIFYSVEMFKDLPIRIIGKDEIKLIERIEEKKETDITTLKNNIENIKIQLENLL